MAAWEFQLSEDLQEAVQNQVLSTSEAWQLMDELLLTGLDRPWPEELWPLVERIRFSRVEVESRAVH